MNETLKHRSHRSVLWREPSTARTALFYRMMTLFGLLLAFLLIQGQAYAQQVLNGTVVDEGGIPLPGASIKIKGTDTDRGTAADVDGKFLLEVPSSETMLQITYHGYFPLEAVVGNEREKTFTLQLDEEKSRLDEVVVVGYGTQKKVNLTGAVSVIDSRAFESVPTQNAVQALQGHIPGLNITQPVGGTLDAKADMNIRGLATIGSGSHGGPLVLIDGMEGDIYTINPQDIESVSVLKDAAASSIYGSRAPFGVILVTTKKGSAGKVTANYNNSSRFNTPINMPKTMDSYTWATYFNEASRNAGWGDWIEPERVQRIKDYIDGKITTTTVPNGWNTKEWGNGYEWANDNIDYYDEIFKDVSFSQEHNLSVSGGNNTTTYYLSANYLGQNGLLNWGKDDAQRYSISGNINAKLSKNVDVSYNMRYIRNEYERPEAMTDNLFQEIGRQSWPTKPLYDPNGILFDDKILLLQDGGVYKTQTTYAYQQGKITITPLAGWVITGDINYRYDNMFRHSDWRTIRQTAVDGVTPAASWNLGTGVYEYATGNDYFNVNAYSDYETTAAENHYFKILGGFQTEHNNYRDISAEKQGLMVAHIPTLNTTSGIGADGSVVPPVVGGSYSSWATAGFFGRFNYNYKEKYLFEGNLRYDGSSRFRSDNRWGWFPSASVGWNVSREEFFKPLESIINTFKIRGSYGSLGNQNTSSLYPTYSTMGYSSSAGSWLINNAKPNISWAPGLISTALTWEKIKTSNVGFDFGLFNNRLTGSFDYFIRKTEDMVGPADELPIILGTSVPNTNNTDLKTKGFELELSWQDRLANGLNYGIRAVLSDSYGEITRYSNPSGTLSTYYEGMKWGEIWGYETVGIAKTDEEMQNHLSTLPNGGQSALGQNWTAGDIMYKDLNGDGKIDWGSSSVDNYGDQKVIGNTTPRYLLGLDLTADWKGFDTRIFFQGVLKRDYFQNSFYFWGANGDGVWDSMGLKEHQDYFRDDPDHHLGLNIDSYFPRPLFGTKKNQLTQTRYLQNAAYMRLKNLQLGYTLPQSSTSKFGVSNLRLFVSGENLFTITNLIEIFDPETISGNGRGNVYPLSRTYSFGLNVTF